MTRVVLAGVPDPCAARLQARVGVPMLCAPSGKAALLALRHFGGGALVIHDDLTGPSAAEVLELASWQPRLVDLDVICCLRPGLGSELVGSLAARLGRGQILFHPVDPEELARELAEALGVVLPPVEETVDDDTNLHTGGLWQRFCSATLARLSVVEQAAQAVRDGVLTTELQRTAEREAHKLAGSLGTYGLHHGSRMAMQAEDLLRLDVMQPHHAAELLELTDAMTQCLYRAPTGSGLPAVPPRTAQAPRPSSSQNADVVLVEDDDALGATFQRALELRGHRVHWLKDGRRAAVALGGPSPTLSARVLVVDADLPGLDGLALLRGLAHDGVLQRSRALVMSSSRDAALPVEARALGATEYLPKPLAVPAFTQRVEQELAG
ncbi:MAG: response regulator [Myxococcota bacterium]